MAEKLICGVKHKQVRCWCCKLMVWMPAVPENKDDRIKCGTCYGSEHPVIKGTGGGRQINRHNINES